MPTIKPGQTEIFRKPGQSEDNLQILKDVKRMVESATPWANTMVIQNKTQHCNIDLHWSGGFITVVVTNPNDEIFKLESPLPELPVINFGI